MNIDVACSKWCKPKRPMRYMTIMTCVSSLNASPPPYEHLKDLWICDLKVHTESPTCKLHILATFRHASVLQDHDLEATFVLRDGL